MEEDEALRLALEASLRLANEEKSKSVTEVMSTALESKVTSKML